MRVDPGSWSAQARTRRVFRTECIDSCTARVVSMVDLGLRRGSGDSMRLPWRHRISWTRPRAPSLTGSPRRRPVTTEVGATELLSIAIQYRNARYFVTSRGGALASKQGVRCSLPQQC